MVLLRLQSYRQSSVAARHNHKRSKQFYGPFPVIARIGQVAYRLGLPENSRIHLVFHISVLKPFRGAHSSPHQSLPPLVVDSHPIDLPLAICASRSILRNGHIIQQILVQWTGCPLEDAAWEDFSEFCKLYPSYHLEDKVNFEAGGNDTLPISLEPIAEVLKEGKVAQDMNKEAQEMSEDPIAETKDGNIGFDGYIGTWISRIYRIYRWIFYMNIDISEINKNTLKFIKILSKSVKMILIIKYIH